MGWVGDATAVFALLDLTGVFANAVLGGVIARSARLDPIGFLTLAVVSGLGGGVLRDVLLQDGPPVALTETAYVATALAGGLLPMALRVEGRVWSNLWPWIDALALGCWAAVGAQKTLDAGLGWLPAILLGTVTAVGGGFVRDVVLRQVPQVLGGNTLYATCALAASGTLVVLRPLTHPTVASLVATLVGAALCLLAWWRHWILPPADEWRKLAKARRRERRRRDAATGPGGW